MIALTVLPKKEMKVDINGSVGELFYEYSKIIENLKKCINELNDFELCQVIDKNAPNDDFKSVQSLLNLILRNCYSNAGYILKHKFNDPTIEIPKSNIFQSMIAYQSALDDLLIFISKVMSEISDEELVQLNPSDKLKTPESQLYDYQQIIEHSMIDLMRIITRIENFKTRMM